RVLPHDCNALIDTGSWRWPPIFQWLQTHGNVNTTEMYRTFNCGVGMVLCVAPQDADKSLEMLAAAGHRAWKIGRIGPGDNKVELLS
ncbi:MAG TPA: AIR synthase-related protein, partial [Halioglobus sp.]